MIRLQSILSHWLWSLSQKIERLSRGLLHHPFCPRRITCNDCRKSVVTLRVYQLSDPHGAGYRPVCRKCYESCPF